MKKYVAFVFIFCLCGGNAVLAQISYGGMPLFSDNSLLRSSSSEFIEMPSFNLDSVKQMDELNKENMRTSFQFAYKFYTRIEKGRQGTMRVLADGTKVWQVGIRSEGAYSINLLFTRFRIPEGGKLFLYNPEHTHIIGSFDHRNNSPENILPVRPVAGETVIIEYSEPADAAFEGELLIGEVNHDYRDILRATEPAADITELSCMPDALCGNVDDKIIRSVVLLVINGNTLCSGTLINNTENDETPYLLTAVHCFDGKIEFPHEPQFYADKAGTIIAFFNYNRPVCESNMKASEEMSLAGTVPQAIIERKDVALLKFKNSPPDYYNAYYAGWNMKPDTYMYPYTNIHHPNGAVKKYGIYNDTIWSYSYAGFDHGSHVEVSSWNIGSTHGGSSGSPLFDTKNLIIGTLTGGSSTCSKQLPDYFTALYQSWDYTPALNLKTYLDPGNTGKLQQEGYDPYAQNPLVRLNNADYNAGDQLISTEYKAPNSGFLFGNNDQGINEFAEEFNPDKTGEILGVYVFIPKMPFSYTSGVDIEIYEGTDVPETLLARKTFQPQYMGYSSGGFNPANKNTNIVPTESFVAFDTPIRVNKKFFVAYKINPSASAGFSVYNTQLAPGKPNTVWLKMDGGWRKASDFDRDKITTSLALQPLIRYTTGNAIQKPDKENREMPIYDRLTGQLSLPVEPGSGGIIYVYSVSGQLIEQIPFSKGEKTFRLSSLPKGSIGIVKIRDKNGFISRKIVY